MVAQYDYDALGRRIRKRADNSGPHNTTGAGDYFFYDGHRVIEQHRPTVGFGKATLASDRPTRTADTVPTKGTPGDIDPNRHAALAPPPGGGGPGDLYREFVYGLNDIDELVMQITQDPLTPEGVHEYALLDANNNVTGMTDSTGHVIEQYSYEPYGRVLSAESVDSLTKPPTANELPAVSGPISVLAGR